MKTRLIAGAIAVVLAAAGTVLVLSYVRGADARAMSGLDAVQVLVADAPITAGTSGADLASLVVTRELPANAVLPNGITSLDQLAGDQALVALEPGEQLLAAKFGPPVAAGSDQVLIPPEFQQVTILLELQRALGGQIKAGDTVGVFLSVKDASGVGHTHLTAQKVLVTRVQQAASTDAAAPGAPAVGTSSASASIAAPSSPTTAPAAPPPTSLTESLLITVATTAAIAEKIAFTAEFGSIWLSAEPASAFENPTQVIDGTLVFQ
jgi:pilus assembly protein CpaB